MNRRQALKLLAATGASGIIAGCGVGGDQDDVADASTAPVAIGLLIPQAGPMKSIGDDLLRGFQLYLTMHGNQLGGHPVRLETAPEGDTPASAIAGLRALFDRNVLAVSGIANPVVMNSDLRSAVRQAKVPVVGANGSPFNLQGEVFIWRTSYTGNEPGLAMGRYMAENVDGRIVMVMPDGGSSQDVVLGFVDGFGSASRLVREPIYTADLPSPTRGSYDRAIRTIVNQGPEAVFAHFSGAAAVEFVRAYRAAGIRAPLYGTGFLTEGGAVAALGGSAAGIFTAMNYSADLAFSANQIFASAFRKAHSVPPSAYAMASFDAAHVLDRAIQLAGDDLTAQQVNLKLGQVGQIDSPRGLWQFNQSRTPQQKWYLREVRRDGQINANVVMRELTTLG
ncbi:ABC transporter substrate-binding protein [Pilimelia columellifera]